MRYIILTLILIHGYFLMQANVSEQEEVLLPSITQVKQVKHPALQEPVEVVVTMELSKCGTVKCIKAIEGDAKLHLVAKRLVTQAMEFTPVVINGIPVDAVVRLPLVFGSNVSN